METGITNHRNKAAAQRAAEAFKVPTAPASAITVTTLMDAYIAEKIPKRIDTRRTYTAWINNHITPKWGKSLLTDLQARPVELWLDSLTLAPSESAKHWPSSGVTLTGWMA
jgi:hypothetical protein